METTTQRLPSRRFRLPQASGPPSGPQCRTGGGRGQKPEPREPGRPSGSDPPPHGVRREEHTPQPLAGAGGRSHALSSDDPRILFFWDEADIGVKGGGRLAPPAPTYGTHWLLGWRNLSWGRCDMISFRDRVGTWEECRRYLGVFR